AVDVLLRPARSRGALALEETEAVSVVRARRVRVALVALARRARDERADRARIRALVGRPVEAVVLAGRAEHTPREGRRLSVASLGSVLALRVDERVQRRERRELVAPDAPVGDLLEAGVGVEVPLAVDVHERDRHRPAVVAEHRDLAALARVLEGELLV